MLDFSIFTTEFQRQIAEWHKAREAEKPWPWPKSKPEAPQFDADAHTAFMRSLG